MASGDKHPQAGVEGPRSRSRNAAAAAAVPEQGDLGGNEALASALSESGLSPVLQDELQWLLSRVTYTIKGAVVQLSYPLHGDDGAPVETLEMRRPNVHDQLTAQKESRMAVGKNGEVSAEQATRLEINMFARLCNMTPAEIELLDMVDYSCLQVAYKGFLSRRSVRST